MRETTRHRAWRSRVPPWRGPLPHPRAHHHRPLLWELTCALVAGAVWVYVLALFAAIWATETSVWVAARGLPILWRVVTGWSVYTSHGRTGRDTVG